MTSLGDLLTVQYKPKTLTDADKAEIYRLKHGTVCPKCHGAKIIPEYLHNKAGKCFACNGRGRVF
jgi:DnaJ-class molecular chaperone